MKQSLHILTEEDKKYLRKVSRYLQSYGLNGATIRLLELDDYCGFELDDIDFESPLHLANNYSVEVPDGLKPILKKMIEAGMDKVDDADCPDYINYGGVDVEINVENSEITASYFFNYYDRGEPEGVEWSVEEDPELKSIFDEIIENNGNFEPIMEIRYNGSGDSGYVEDRFENNESVPAGVQDWCERELSNNFGGWENNEGADGYFKFDMEKNTIELVHTYNVDEQRYITLSEDKFGK